mgnify:CR=1 FL=1
MVSRKRNSVIYRFASLLLVLMLGLFIIDEMSYNAFAQNSQDLSNFEPGISPNIACKSSLRLIF